MNYLMNSSNDKVLKRINKTLSKEREAEYITSSTVWLYRILMMAFLMVCVLFAIQSMSYGYKELKLINKYNVEIRSLEKEIGTLTQKLEASEQLISNQNKHIEAMKESFAQKDEMIAKLQGLNYTANMQTKELESENVELNNTITSLTGAYKDLNEQYKTFAKRSELYDKYEYALFNDEGGADSRTDLTYDMCEYGEKLMLDYGLDPDLLFSIGMTESRYVEKAKNPRSTATGFQQFLEPTGKWVYGQLGYTDTYDHSTIQKNGYISLECGAWYLNYLYDQNNGDIIGVVESYRGIKNPVSYINKVNSYLLTKDKTLDTIEENLQLCADVS